MDHYRDKTDLSHGGSTNYPSISTSINSDSRPLVSPNYPAYGDPDPAANQRLLGTEPVTAQPIASPGTAGHNTIVYINTELMLPRGVPRDWTSGICACGDDLGICLMTAFVPCDLFCLARDMGENFCTPCCVPVPLIPMRALFRGRHNIQGNIINDATLAIWCTPCTKCQLARELKYIKAGRAMP